MKIIINGAGGRMGQEICRLASEGYKGSSLAAAIDKMGGEKSIITSASPE